jgi:hypothetical protein
MASILSLGRRAAKILLAVLLVGSCASVQGNDMVGYVPAGGIQPRKEARISMEKERLKISLNQVNVEYEFLNLADQDITIEVAFPYPPYTYSEDWRGSYPSFQDFRVWADGREVKYQTAVRAELDHTDYSGLLRGLGIDIARFGNFDAGAEVNNSQLAELPKAAKENLTRLGLIDPDGSPMWEVHIICYWKQLFPAHKTLHVRHEYSPGVGTRSAAQFSTQSAQPEDLVGEACMESHEGVTPAGRITHTAENPQLVTYILKSANTWKTPIKDFEVIVERPEVPGAGKTYVSFCWDGKVQPLDKDHFVARKADFVPTQDLNVWYLGADSYH